MSSLRGGSAGLYPALVSVANNFRGPVLLRLRKHVFRRVVRKTLFVVVACGELNVARMRDKKFEGIFLAFLLPSNFYYKNRGVAALFCCANKTGRESDVFVLF